MAKTLKDLFFALLNATLILLALCLFLVWKVAQSVENVQTGFKENLQVVIPLKEQVQGIRGELEGIRSALVAIRQQDGTLDTASRAQLNDAMQSLKDMEGKLAGAQSRMLEIVDNPEDLINYAITTSAEAISGQYMALRGCVPAT